MLTDCQDQLSTNAVIQMFLTIPVCKSSFIDDEFF